MKLIMASSNKNKIAEIKGMLNDVEILSLKDIGFNAEIEETGSSFNENALIKAQTIYNLYHIPTIADDSGLCVPALDGAPGIYSHRFAGEECDDNKNNALLIKKMAGKTDRRAYYECAICYYDGSAHYFNGQIWGEIIEEARGSNGFGYDPYFYIPSLNKTMAELSMDEKNKISHRHIATEGLGVYLNELSRNI